MDSTSEQGSEAWLIGPAGPAASQELWRPLLARRLSLPLIADARVSQVAAEVEKLPIDTIVPAHRQIVVEVPSVLAHARVRTRASDVLLGRGCAQLALRQAGAGSDHVGAGTNRAPIWPEGWTGSLSHASGVAWAVTARQSDFSSLGIDLENVLVADALESVRSLALTPEERRLACSDETGDMAWLTTLIFSAKESIFKCLNPLVDQFIDFTEMELSSVDRAAGLLQFTCLRRLSDWMDRGQVVDVIFTRAGDLALTATGWPSAPCHGVGR